MTWGRFATVVFSTLRAGCLCKRTLTHSDTSSAKRMISTLGIFAWYATFQFLTKKIDGMMSTLRAHFPLLNTSAKKDRATKHDVLKTYRLCSNDRLTTNFFYGQRTECDTLLPVEDGERVTYCWWSSLNHSRSEFQVHMTDNTGFGLFAENCCGR